MLLLARNHPSSSKHSPSFVSLCIFCALASLVIYLFFVAGVTVASAQEKPVSFIRDVAPILKEYCFTCHDAKKKSGKYDMTTVEKLLEGGANGEPIVAGKPEESEFYELIVTQDERRMPPRDKGEAVPAEKAAVIARWIKEGAKIDPGLDVKADLWRELRVRWVPPQPPKSYVFPIVLNALAFTPDAKSLVVGGHHELTVWEVSTGQLQKRVHMRPERAYGLAFLPDGLLAVAGSRPGQEGDVRVYDLQVAGRVDNGVDILDGVNDPKVLRKVLHDADDSVLALAVSADGSKLAAGGCDRAVRVWDISKGIDQAQLEQTVENHADWILGVAFSRDGKHLLTASRDKTAKSWDLTKKESVITVPEHQDIVYGVASGTDSALGYSVGADKSLRSWRVAGDGKTVKRGEGHSDHVLKVAVSPKEPIIATGSKDKTVRLWSEGDLKTIRTLSGLTDEVFALAFSSDGQLIAAGSYDGEVRIWKVADGSLIKAFNASPGYVAKTAGR